MEQIAELEKEMNQVHTQFKDAEQHYSSDLLNLVLAKGFIAKLLANESVKHFIECNESEILEHFELVVNAVSMEEAVQQQQAEGLAPLYPKGFSSNNATPRKRSNANIEYTYLRLVIQTDTYTSLGPYSIGADSLSGFGDSASLFLEFNEVDSINGR